MINIIFISLIFGISQKLADAVNEHGTVLFKGANVIFGLIFGFTGSILILIDNNFAEFYLGLVIYWLIAGKLDYFNHQLTASIMLIVSLYYFNSRNFNINIHNIIFVILLFVFFKIFKKYLLAYNLKINYHIDQKIHHFLIAMIIGYWFSNWFITISIVFTIIGIMFTILFLKHQNNYLN